MTIHKNIFLNETVRFSGKCSVAIAIVRRSSSKILNLVTKYDIAKSSNNCTFNNNTPEHFSPKTNKYDYAILR